MPLRALRLSELLDAVGARTPAPASGAAAALTGALAAALVELAARFADEPGAVEAAGAHRARLLELADADSAAYAAFLADRSEAARARTIEIPLEIAAEADAVTALAARVRAGLTSAVAGDAEAGGELARSAAAVARRLAELNRPA